MNINFSSIRVVSPRAIVPVKRDHAAAGASNIALDTVSFGMAKINKKGNEIIAKTRTEALQPEDFSYKVNDRYNDAYYSKQGYFLKNDGASISDDSDALKDVFKKYGGTKFNDKNAQFVRFQILPSKKAILKKFPISAPDALIALYKENYDNPKLSRSETKTFYNTVEKYMKSDDAMRYRRLLDPEVTSYF